MTSLFGSRRRAEVFAARVDAATAGRAAAAGGARSEADAEIEVLVSLATSLRNSSLDELATPRAAFTADLRDQLLTEAVTALPSAQSAPSPIPAFDPALRSRPSRRRERRLAAAVTAAVLLGGSAGMATAAQGALPGEPLYSVKRGIEKATVTLSTSSVGQGRELLSQASGRLHEVELLMEGDTAERAQIPGTLDDFHTEARKGTELMMKSYESTENPNTIRSLQVFASSSMATLESIVESAPADAQPALDSAALLMTFITEEAEEVCPTCEEVPDLPPDAVLSSSGGSVGKGAGLPGLDGELIPASDDHAILEEAASAPPGGLPGGLPGALPGGLPGGLPDDGSGITDPQGGQAGSDPATSPDTGTAAAPDSGPQSGAPGSSAAPTEPPPTDGETPSPSPEVPSPSDQPSTSPAEAPVTVSPDPSDAGGAAAGDPDGGSDDTSPGLSRDSADGTTDVTNAPPGAATAP